jgi:rhodanese-related sulfurtransferase
MVQTITVQELKGLMDAGIEFQLIDVREPIEYSVSNLGGLPIPLAMIPAEIEQIATDRKVIIHCRSGKRSEMAIRLLQAEGLEADMYNLTGGIIAWSQEIEPGMIVG